MNNNRINLKLEIFRISLKKKGGSDEELLNFSDFFKSLFLFNSEDENNYTKEKGYKEFIAKYIQSFNSKFELNRQETKGISANKEHKFGFRSEQNIIDGDVIGGVTGIQQTVFNKADPDNQTGLIFTSDVSTLPYYIKLWTPYDYTTGVLMVQSYSKFTVTDMVKFHLSKFFQKYDYSIKVTSFVPNEIKEYYKNNSSVYKVALVKDKINSGKRKLINPMFAKFENLKIRIEVSGFRKEVHEFWDYFDTSVNPIQANLEDLDMKEKDDYEIIAYYTDDEGHRSHTSVKKNFDIKPTIFLPHSLKQKNLDYFDFEKIKLHTDAILDQIKNEIGYAKKASSNQ